jgi:glyceraldehyde 3-phosphate dehydrogenase
MRVAINGFGRTGRTFFRHAFGRPELTIVAVNDLADVENLAYLLRHDTIYGPYTREVRTAPGKLFVDGQEIMVLAEADPARLPWAELQIDIVVESTGLFTKSEKAKAHLDAGARRVVISAPADDEVPHVLPGANQDRFDSQLSRITADASCTTNATVPVLNILQVNPGIEKALASTVHAYTSIQGLVDGPNKKDPRQGRAAPMNIVPLHTGAADAVVRSQPWLKDKFDGIAMRVPVITGSLMDLTFIAKRSVTAEEVNEILRAAAREEKWRDIFTVTEEPLVSSDIIGNHHASIAELSLTRVVGGNLVKVCAWYDNEWGYSHSLLLHVLALKGML